MFRSRRLGLECLEARWTPDATTLTPPPDAPPPTTAPIDPTLNPQNTTQTTVAVTVTAVGQLQMGGSVNVTVSGLQASNFGLGVSIQFSYGGANYVAFASWTNQDGTTTLNLLNGAALTNLGANTNASVIVGGGGTTTPTAPPVTPPVTPPPIIDPTLLPAGY